MIDKIKWAVTHPVKAMEKVYNRSLLLLPDELFLKVKFRQLMGKWPNLKDPRTFSEKLQWLKLHNRRPEYTIMVDEIDFSKLPNQFVLKTTHDSGGVVICKDKSRLDMVAARKKLTDSLKHNYYRDNREWPYKNVPRRIIAEMYIEPDPKINDLPDYKFFCFNGEPKYCQVITGREKEMCIDFFDKDWEHQPFHEPCNFPFATPEPRRPEHYEQIWEAARRLAQEKPFVRVDFYHQSEHIYFGEITFFPTSGMGGFNPDKYDEVLGRMINLQGVSGGGVLYKVHA